MGKIFLHKAASANSNVGRNILLTDLQHELIYCLNGKFFYLSNNCLSICRMDEFIIIPPNTKTFIYENEATCLHWQFDTANAYGSPQIEPRSDNTVSSFKELLLLMMREKERNDSYNRECLAIYEKILLLRLISSLEYTDDSVLKLPSHLNFVISYFKEHCHEKINIPVLLEETGYSYNHVRHLFKNAFGVSPKQYLMQIRLEKARKLIQNTSLSINEIAGRCGFESTVAFNAYYKKRYLKSPIECRLEQKG